MSFDFQIVPPIFGYVAKLRLSERKTKKSRFFVFPSVSNFAAKRLE